MRNKTFIFTCLTCLYIYTAYILLYSSFILIFSEKNNVAKTLEKAESDLIALRAIYEEVKRTKEVVIDQVRMGTSITVPNTWQSGK